MSQYAFWERPRPNLAILYALTAEHADRDEFVELLSDIHNDGAVQRAQAILNQSGAVAFCMYHMILTYREASQLADRIDVPKSLLLSNMLDYHITPVRCLMDEIGVEDPDGLIRC